MPCEVQELLPGGVGTAIVNDNNFMRNFVKTQLQVQMLDGGADTTFFIVSGYDDAQERKRHGIRIGDEFRSGGHNGHDLT